MKNILFGIRYLSDYWFSGKVTPLICGLVLHNKCNLRCLHCNIFERPEATVCFSEAVTIMEKFYAEGGRCLYLEGGEPFLWKENSFTFDDIVIEAKKIGFLTVIIYTNGTYPLVTKADTIFVSVDGLQPTHDSLRGKSFHRIMENIRKSAHPSIYVNYTINSVNKDDIEDFCKFTGTMPQIKGTFFYFHTPYYGYDRLFLNREMKNEVLSRLIKYKSHYKILNSTAGLKSALRNDWKKRLTICQVYEGGEYYSCCRENANEALCKDCGYLSYAEIDQTLKLKPGAIINALKYF